MLEREQSGTMARWIAADAPVLAGTAAEAWYHLHPEEQSVAVIRKRLP
jgi:hypothetical protein